MDNIRLANKSDFDAVASAYFIDHWLTDTMVVASGTYKIHDLKGVVALTPQDKVVGLITYAVHGNALEIISLDATPENQGTGSALLAEAEKRAIEDGLTMMVLTTTNDNLNAMQFYMKRGYRMTKIIRGAVDRAREKKTSIPVVGQAGIPLHDEVLLSKAL
jgi:GNAT superfamily N-acetyltransferase